MDEGVSPQSPILVGPSCPSGRLLRSVERKGGNDLSSAGRIKEVEAELPQKELKLNKKNTFWMSDLGSTGTTT